MSHEAEYSPLIVFSRWSLVSLTQIAPQKLACSLSHALWKSSGFLSYIFSYIAKSTFATIVSPQCAETIFTAGDFLNAVCVKLLISKLLGFAIVAGGAIGSKTSKNESLKKKGLSLFL